MNKKTTYELTIADKLQQLPLPDMEDAIWARIKTQLDLDLPEGDGGGSNTPQAPSGGWMWSAGLLTFVAAFLTVLLLTKKSDQPAPTDNIDQNIEAITAPSPQQIPAPVQTPGNSTTVPLPAPSAGTITMPSEGISDSLLAPPLTLQPPVDTLPSATALVPPPLTQDSLIKTKPKTRGVQDISDADYRIVPTKRDSS
ncbi:MAG TPA: hypothetical protein VGN63_11055 [Flavisolibacter sp.]|jgi:hypothetical protein|nr:hypothetical protein [Flavisolibacter sp.]